MKFEKIFNPKTVAVVGATERPSSVGRGLVENLQEGKRDLFYINPNREELFGEKSYSKVTDVSEEIDLAIIAVPKNIAPEVVDDCIEKQVGAVIIISAGFAEADEEGEKRQEEISKKLEKADIPLVGPNCLGIIRPPVNLNASFAPGSPKEGTLSLISQSGALIDSIVDGSKNQNYGFSLIVSVGNAAGLSLVDYVRVADEDPNTEVIMLYIEGIEDGREFLRVLEEVKTPVVAIKGGKTEKSKKAISSHTGSLAGRYEVFSAALRQAGVFEVDSLEEMFDVAKLLAWQSGSVDEVGVVTNGGGAGVLLTDALYNQNLTLPDLSEETIRKIKEDMHPDYSKGNPLDIVGDALPDRYESACRGVISQENISALVVIQTLQIMTDPLENAKRIVKLKKEFKKPIATVFMGAGKETKEAIVYLEKNGIPNYSDPKRAAKPLQALK